MERLVTCAGFGVMTTFWLYWSFNFLKQSFGSQVDLSLTSYFTEVVVGLLSIVIGFLGFAFRAFNMKTPEINSYPEPIWIWLAVVSITLGAYFLAPDQKILIRLLVLEVLVTAAVLILLPLINFAIKGW